MNNKVIYSGQAFGFWRTRLDTLGLESKSAPVRARFENEND